MLDRQVAPPFVKSTSLHLPAAQTHRLPNGGNLHFFQSHDQPVVKVEALASAGKWYEPKPGISHFTAQLLEKGTSNKDAFAIAEFFERHGANLEISAGFDHVSIALYALRKNLRQVIHVFFELLSDPTFPDRELDRFKQIFIQNLRVNNEKTSFLSSKYIRQQVFGASHPYGWSPEEGDVEMLQGADLRSYFENRVSFDSFFVVGGHKDEAMNEVMAHASHLRSSVVPDNVVAKVNFVAEDKVVDRSKSVQSSLRLGKPSVGRHSKDYFGVQVVNHYLGGFFGSQLMRNLREEKGLTYGIHSSLHVFQHDSMLLIGTDVNKENRELALDEIRKELRRMNHDSLAVEDVELAKRHFIGSLQSEIANPFSILNKMKTIALFDLPPDHYQQMVDYIDQVTPEQLSELASLHFAESSFASVIVG